MKLLYLLYTVYITNGQLEPIKLSTDVGNRVIPVTVNLIEENQKDNLSSPNPTEGSAVVTDNHTSTLIEPDRIKKSGFRAIPSHFQTTFEHHTIGNVLLMV